VTADEPQAKKLDEPKAKTWDEPQAKNWDEPQAKTWDEPQAKTWDEPQAKTYEVLVVGAGPAGISAALWARSLDLDVEVTEAAGEAGGQLLYVHFHPREVLGVMEGNGPAIAAAGARQLAAAGIPVSYGMTATALRTGSTPTVVFADGTERRPPALVIATGARRRRLRVPGERELDGQGLTYSATRDREWLAGRDVAVVGGGDGAFENALLLAAAGCAVTVIARGTIRARAEFRAKVAAEPRIRVLEGTQVVAVLGEGSVRAVRVRDVQGERELACTGVVVKLGVEPNTEWCRDVLAHDAEGWLTVDARFATSAPRVWAAGDVVRPLRASIPAATAHGAIAAAAVRAALRGT